MTIRVSLRRARVRQLRLHGEWLASAVHRAVVKEQTLVVLALLSCLASILGVVYGMEKLARAFVRHMPAETLKLVSIGSFRGATRTPVGPTLWRRTFP